MMDILVALSHIIFIILKYALTEFNIATLDSFWLVTAWYIILYPFPSPDFLYLKCVTYTHDIPESFFSYKVFVFLSNSDNLSFNSVFKPFTYKVNTDC